MMFGSSQNEADKIPDVANADHNRMVADLCSGETHDCKWGKCAGGNDHGSGYASGNRNS
jgi:hypothetical protein